MLVDRARVAAALPDYDLGEQLGSGGYGLVLAGLHRGMQRDVAIKVLAGGGRIGTGEGRAAAGFAVEAVVLANLDHPHIVRVYDYKEFDDIRLIVMELLSGGPLSNHRKDLDGPQVCAVGLAVASALSCAHAHGVLHRDIKPENMLFDAAGRLKVADFGIAKVVTGPDATASAVVGTPLFMAPEQMMAGRLSPASDIYSLGVVLHLLLSGGSWPADQSYATTPMMRRDQFVSRRSLPEDVPAPVANVVLRALAEDPAARPSSARELALDLAEAATLAYGSGWTTRTGMALHLEEDVRLAAEGSAAVGSSHGAAGSVLTVPGSPAPPSSWPAALGSPSPETPSPESTPPGSVPPGSVPPAQAGPGPATPSPEGGARSSQPGARRRHRAQPVAGSGGLLNRRNLLIAVPTAIVAAGGAAAAAVTALGGRDSPAEVPLLRPLGTPLIGHTSSINSLVVFPGSQILASGGRDRTVRLWDVSDRPRPRPIGGALPGSSEGVVSLAVSFEGDRLAAGHWDGTVRMWDVSDPAHPERIDAGLDLGKEEVTSVRFVEDGHTLVTGGRRGAVRIWDVTDPALPRRLSAFDTVPIAQRGGVAFARPTLAADATLLAAYDGQAISLWNVTDRNDPAKLSVSLTGHRGEVHGFAFTLDSHSLASGGSKDAGIRLWDLTAAEPTQIGRTLTGHTSTVWALAYSPDGTRLISGSWDRTIRLWDVQDRSDPRLIVASGPSHRGRILAVAYAPDGRTVFSGCESSEIRVWDVADARL